ncbi:MAG: trypsin-like peptidase domain-containing protein [Promethearchaeota archaeon]
MPYVPPEYLKTIVLLGNINHNRRICPLGTGFLVQVKKEGYSRFWLVTAAHVVKDDMSYFFMGKDRKINRISFEALKEKLGVEWHIFQDDFAIINVGFDLEAHDIKLIQSDMIFSRERLFPGEDVFFLGYPLGFIEDNDITPFIRMGIIARMYDNKNRFIIDGYSTGGSSGSPLFIHSKIFSRHGQSRSMPQLIGMIQGHIPHPNHPDENTNLALALSVEKIHSEIMNLNQA